MDINHTEQSYFQIEHTLLPSLSVQGRNKYFMTGNLIFSSKKEASTFFQSIQTATTHKRAMTIDISTVTVIGKYAKQVLASLLTHNKSNQIMIMGSTCQSNFLRDVKFLNKNIIVTMIPIEITDTLKSNRVPDDPQEIVASAIKKHFTSVCPKIWEMFDDIVTSCKQNSQQTFCITGESGSGKSSMVRAIADVLGVTFRSINASAYSDPNYFLSDLYGRTEGAFTDVSASPGLITEAEDGILFIDEIGDTSLGIQNQLLTVIEDRKYHALGSGGEHHKEARCTFIFATNKNFKSLVTEKKMREDFYFRFHHNIYQIPKLKDRKEDIPHLIHHFIGKALAELGMTSIKLDPGVIHTFLNTDMVDNVRGIEIPIKKAVQNNITGTVRSHEIYLTPTGKHKKLIENELNVIEDIIDDGGWDNYWNKRKKNVMTCIRKENPHYTIDKMALDTKVSRSKVQRILSKP